MKAPDRPRRAKASLGFPKASSQVPVAADTALVSLRPAEQPRRRLNGGRQYRCFQRYLSPDLLASRSGPGGHSVSYLEGWQAINLANTFLGVDRWSSKVLSLEEDHHAPGNKHIVSYSCTMEVTWYLPGGRSVVRQDVGGGKGHDNDLGAARQSGKKEAVTDALKRCFRQFGPALGNCVYDRRYAAYSRTSAARAAMQNGDTKDPWVVAPVVRASELHNQEEPVPGGSAPSEPTSIGSGAIDSGKHTWPGRPAWA